MIKKDKDNEKDKDNKKYQGNKKGQKQWKKQGQKQLKITKDIKNSKDNQEGTKQKCPRYSYVESPIRAWDADKETRYFSCILRKQIFLRSTSFAYICIYETIRSVWKIQWRC